MKQSRILIVGGTGTVGSQLVQNLKAKGRSVLIASSKKSNDPEKVYLDLVTREGLDNAFAEVDQAFILSPPGYADQYAILSPLIQEAKKRGLRKVVLMTAMGANASESTPFRRAELELEKSGLNYNILRPNWFFQNFNTFWIQGINQSGKIYVPAGDAKTSFIDARDIADVATQLLTSEKFNNQAFDLSGGNSATHAEVASAISKATDRKIVYENADPEEFKKMLISVGLNSDYSQVMLNIFGFLREGYNAAVTGSVKQILGREPISLGQYCSDYKSSWNV